MRARARIRLGVAAFAALVAALAAPALAPAQQFGNLVVDTTADGNDGECTRDCTLREAVALADPNLGQWVQLPPGVYRVTQGPIVLQRNAIVFGVGFTGSSSFGARTTIVDARGTSRVFEVPAGSSAVLAGLTVTGGTADTGGGVLVSSGAQLSIYASILRENIASGRGGAIANAGTLSIANSTLNGNRAAAGGALANEAGAGGPLLWNSTFSGNTGGGIAAAGSVTLQRVTIASNVGPGITQEGSGAVEMMSVILAGNQGDCAGTVGSAPRTLTRANLDSDGTCAWADATQGRTADPLLSPLANNGGPTDTHAIRAGSPAIDSADQDVCGPTGTDQRSAPAVNGCDIGAFEFGGQPPEFDLPPPVAGETINVNRSRGKVRVKIPGSDEFFDLEQAQQVPVGSTFDTTKGRVNLVAAGGSKAWFYEGLFKFNQPHGSRPLSTLSLTGKLSCGGGNKASAAQRKAKKRRLWGDGKGRFRTKGKHSAATVVGTRWLVEDRCNGTLTRVTRGKVRVTARGRTRTLKAGQQFFARAR